MTETNSSPNRQSTPPARINKKLLIIGGAVIIVIVVVAALFAGRTGSSTGPAAQPTLAQPAPTGIFTQPANVTFSFTSTPTIPSSLPTYTFQPIPLTTVEQEAANAAPGLGLDATPSALTRGGSYMKTWSRGSDALLTLTQTSGAVTVVFHQIKAVQSPGALAPDIAIQQFLLALIPPQTNVSLRAAGTSNGPFDGLLVLDTPPPTSYTNYLYSYVIGSEHDSRFYYSGRRWHRAVGKHRPSPVSRCRRHINFASYAQSDSCESGRGPRHAS